MKNIDITGLISGRLTAIKPTGKDKQHNVMWECLCSCGNTTYVKTAFIRNKHIRSCGCLRRDNTSKAKKTHGMRFTTEYKSWRHMKDRCLNPNIERYPNYGGRGITICDRWLNSFQNFFDDMGFKPSSKHTLDRIDNNDNYCPSNCKWSTKSEQANNMTTNIKISFKGKTQTASQWADELGINKQTLYARLNAYKWSPEKALTTPVRKLSKGSV